MAEPATTAKAITAAAKALLTEDQNGERGIKKILFAVIGLVFVVVVIVEAALMVVHHPFEFLKSIFSDDSIVDTRVTWSQNVPKPIIATDQVGFLPLPVNCRQISSPYGYRTLNGKQNWHEGVDFPVAFDSPVMSVAPGTVVAVGIDPSYGSYVKIRHEMRVPEKNLFPWQKTVFYSFYAHLDKIYVFENDVVKQNQQIGLSGGDPSRHFAGTSTGAHLHFEIREQPQYGSQVDPYDWILKPLTPEQEEAKEDITFIKDREDGDYYY